MTSGNWMNGDGLYLEFGTTKPTLETAGEYKTYGEMREVFLDLDLTALTSSSVIISNTLKFPLCRIFEVVLEVQNAATSGGAATLDIGLVQEDRTTAISATGFVAALALASINTVGQKVTLNIGSTSVGALVGTTTTNVGHITARANAAVYTAGKLRVLIRYYNPAVITQ